MIDHIDPVNRLIYLDSSTPNTEINPIDIYREIRALRRTNEALRPYDMFMTYKGGEKKNPDGSKRTERYGVLLKGTLIVPYNTSHVLNITGTLISDTGLEGRECFDRSRLSSGVMVDIDYTPKQVEVITVTSGGTAGLTQEEHNKLMSIPTALENAKGLELHLGEEVIVPGYVQDGYIQEGYASNTPENSYFETGYTEEGYMIEDIISSYFETGYTEEGYMIGDAITTSSGISMLDKIVAHVWAYFNRSLTTSIGLTPEDRARLMAIPTETLTQEEYNHLMALDTSNNIVAQDLKPLFDYNDVTIVGAEE